MFGSRVLMQTFPPQTEILGCVLFRCSLGLFSLVCCLESRCRCWWKVQKRSRVLNSSVQGQTLFSEAWWCRGESIMCSVFRSNPHKFNYPQNFQKEQMTFVRFQRTFLEAVVKVLSQSEKLMMFKVLRKCVLFGLLHGKSHDAAR